MRKRENGPAHQPILLLSPTTNNPTGAVPTGGQDVGGGVIQRAYKNRVFLCAKNVRGVTGPQPRAIHFGSCVG